MPDDENVLRHVDGTPVEPRSRPTEEEFEFAEEAGTAELEDVATPPKPEARPVEPAPEAPASAPPPGFGFRTGEMDLLLSWPVTDTFRAPL